MRNIEKYYQNTKNLLPHKNIKKFIKIEKKVGRAIELGCGAGRDTIFLIKNNWNVLSIDKEDTKKIIIEKLNEEEKKRFRFLNENFENIELENNDLVVANFSLPFCDRNYFNEFWNKIIDSISEGGYFVGNFFGLNDSWAKTKDKMIFLSKEQVLELLTQFEILEFEENERNGKTALGKLKHWHTYEIIAKKKGNQKR